MSLDDLAGRLDQQLAAADAALARTYPGDRGVRQPLHTVYVPAGSYAAGLVPEWRDRALAVLDEHGASAGSFARASGSAGSCRPTPMTFSTCTSFRH